MAKGTFHVFIIFQHFYIFLPCIHHRSMANKHHWLFKMAALCLPQVFRPINFTYVSRGALHASSFVDRSYRSWPCVLSRTSYKVLLTLSVVQCAIRNSMAKYSRDYLPTCQNTLACTYLHRCGYRVNISVGYAFAF